MWLNVSLLVILNSEVYYKYDFLVKERFMKKHFLSLLLVLTLIPATLFAVPVVITWEWLLDDPAVTAFRYQIGGEDPNKWTVVDASQTSYTVEGLDGSQSYTLYLQQSYDGINFSSSAQATAEPLAVVAAPVVETASVTPAKEEPVVAPVVQEKVAEPVATEQEKTESVAPVVEEKKEEPVAKAGTPAVVPSTLGNSVNRFNFTFGLYGDALYKLEGSLVSPHTWDVAGGLDLSFNNIVSFGKLSGVGLDIMLGYEPYSEQSWKNFFTAEFWQSIHHRASASALVKYNLALDPVAVSLGVGAFGVYPLDGSAFSLSNLKWGLLGKFGITYNINKSFFVGLDANYRYYLVPSGAMTVGGGLVLGFKL